MNDGREGIHGTRVLVVDDNRDLVVALTTGLSELGYSARGAFDGLEALEAAVAFRPQAAIIDLMLPVIDGWALAERLRSNPVFKRPKLIALSGLSSHDHRRRSLLSGFDEHLVKPISLKMLHATLDAQPA